MKRKIYKKRKTTKNTIISSLTILILVLGGIMISFVWGKYFNEDSPNPTSEPLVSLTPTEEPTQTPTSTVAPTLTPTLIPTLVPTSTPAIIPTPTPQPTKNPFNIDITGISNYKLGWYYSPGSNGAPANISEEVKGICNTYGGIWQGDTTIKKVYITMDVGYEYNNNTTKILNIAKEKEIKINFFITGTILKDPNLQPLVTRMNNEGHLVGNHSLTHPSFPDLLNGSGVSAIVDEMKAVENLYSDLTGESMVHYMRPPMGEYSRATMHILNEMGYKSVYWSFAYRDWLTDNQPDPDEAKNTILKNLHNGSILLLHTVSNTNVQILPDLIDEIRNRGYEITLLTNYE